MNGRAALNGVYARGGRAGPLDRGLRRVRRQAPSRQAPLALVLREDLGWFIDLERVELAGDGEWAEIPGLSSAAREVAAYLDRRGASFMNDIARGTGRVPAEVEDALWELVAQGLVTGDGMAGLRVLLQPADKRRTHPRHVRALAGGRSLPRMMPVGRWALWGAMDAMPSAEQRVERFAQQLLRRYGVVFRDLLARESLAPPWRELLRVYRRMEARGEIRGGRFVGGLIGEQYALPEAVEALRAGRRTQTSDELVLVSSGDPLNLVGILTPGGRVSPYSGQMIAYRDGVPIEVGPLGTIRSRLQTTGGVAAHRSPRV